MQPTAIVIGAGIVGLATARALAVKGYKVTVFERTSFAGGASVRNFGMLWPIGQTSGKLYDRAVRSRDIWEFIGESGAFWFDSYLLLLKWQKKMPLLFWMDVRADYSAPMK